jgi:segregation and condensation protein B
MASDPYPGSSSAKSNGDASPFGKLSEEDLERLAQDLLAFSRPPSSSAEAETCPPTALSGDLIEDQDLFRELYESQAPDPALDELVESLLELDTSRKPHSEADVMAGTAPCLGQETTSLDPGASLPLDGPQEHRTQTDPAELTEDIDWEEDGPDPIEPWVEEVVELEEATADWTTAAKLSVPINLRSLVEALLFVGGKPVEPQQVAERVPETSATQVEEAIQEIASRYDRQCRPYMVVRSARGYLLRLRPQYAGLLQNGGPRKRVVRLSQAAIDVLALVAYGQPITARQIDQIRSVDSSHVLRHLERRGLVSRVPGTERRGKKTEYVTTPRFLEVFHLASLGDLPRPDFSAPS